MQMFINMHCPFLNKYNKLLINVAVIHVPLISSLQHCVGTTFLICGICLTFCLFFQHEMKALFNKWHDEQSLNQTTYPHRTCIC